MPFSRFDTREMVDSYRRLLVELRSVADQPPETPMTSHWPVVGGDYAGGLLVAGQAVFGWIPRWRLEDLATDEGIKRVMDETRAPLNERADPMSWIATNSHRTSPFWRTVHLISDAMLTNPASNWHSRIAWTNLYPVSPNEPAGNPYGELLEFQTAAAAKFLASTVAALKPRLVLVLGGPYWWPFAEGLGFDSMKVEARPLLRSGNGLGTHWLVGWHPAGAQRRGWAADGYAARVIEAAANEPRTFG
jgi:hypothetical protein